MECNATAVVSLSCFRAFWFKDCFHAHPNGLYSEAADCVVPNEPYGLAWYHWKGTTFKYSAKQTKMMVRPTSA